MAGAHNTGTYLAACSDDLPLEEIDLFCLNADCCPPSMLSLDYTAMVAVHVEDSAVW